MSFISLTFAIFFFTFICFYHFVVFFAKNASLAQRILLLAASLVFYAWADLRFVPFLMCVIVFSYFCGRFCKNRAALALFICVDLVPLLFFKYVPRELHPSVIFPLGISFFTFQSGSYMVDCYKKKIEPERSLLNVALFVSFFPTISSGPIQRAGSLIPQLKKSHSFDYDQAADGLRLFVWAASPFQEFTLTCSRLFWSVEFGTAPVGLLWFGGCSTACISARDGWLSQLWKKRKFPPG